MGTSTAAGNAATAISARQVSKSFRTGSGATSLKEALVRRGRTQRPRRFTALRDISLDIPQGITLGLIGHNGSGKSTLLQILAGILHPTSGSVAIHGRVASLLELGAGFNGELSGRDNVYLNASLLGLSRAETRDLYGSIVEFSELGEFMEEPVKHYSSGMYVRLGFAVAVHVDPDILLVDEVLAVGDEAFQQKCLAKIEEFQQSGKTILVVSHALDIIDRICDRAVVLDHGEMVFDGEPTFATGTLRMLLGTTPEEEVDDEPEDSDQPTGVPAPPAPVVIESATVHAEADGPEASVLHGGEPLTIRVRVRILPAARELCGAVTVVVMGLGDLPLLVLRHSEPPLVPSGGGHWVIDFTIDDLPHLAGSMVLAVQVEDQAGQPFTTYRSTRGFSFTTAVAGQGLVHTPYRSSGSVHVERAGMPQEVART